MFGQLVYIRIFVFVFVFITRAERHRVLIKMGSVCFSYFYFYYFFLGSTSGLLLIVTRSNFLNFFTHCLMADSIVGLVRIRNTKPWNHLHICTDCGRISVDKETVGDSQSDMRCES